MNQNNCKNQTKFTKYQEYQEIIELELEIEMKNCLLHLKIHHLMQKIGLMIGTFNIYPKKEKGEERENFKRERKSKKESDQFYFVKF